MTRFSRLLVALSVCGMLTALTMPVQARQNVAAPIVALPPVPTTSGEPEFLSEVAGRDALARAVAACAAAPRLDYDARWQVLTRDDRSRIAVRTGSETLRLERSARRAALVSTTDGTRGGEPTVVRFVSDGSTLLCARYAPPQRTFFQIPFAGEVETLLDALITAKVTEAPLTRTARFVLLSGAENGGAGWRGRGTIYRTTSGSIVENLPVDTNDRRTTAVTRRYTLQPKTVLPLAIEEWTVQTNRDRNTTRTVYRRETFTYRPTGGPQRTDRFTTKPAPGYVETSAPSGTRLPDPPGPDQADDRSRALLARWQRAWIRLTAYNARVRIATRALPRTPESRPVAPGDAQQAGAITVTLRRPARLYLSSEIAPVVSNADAGANRRRAVAVAQTAVSDGRTVAVYEGERRDRRRGQEPVSGDDLQLPGRLRRAGFLDRTDALSWLLDGPQSLYGRAEQVEYRGPLPLPDGGSAEAITLRQTITQNGVRRRQRGGGVSTSSPVETTILVTVYFDTQTNLPVRIERFLSTDVQTALQRDDPPNRYFAADYQNVRIDEESAAGIFALPKTP